MPLTDEDAKILVPLTEGKKRKAPIDLHSDVFDPIQLPVFNLSTRKIGFENGKRRVTTTAFEVKCHPNDALILIFYSTDYSQAMIKFHPIAISIL